MMRTLIALALAFASPSKTPIARQHYVCRAW